MPETTTAERNISRARRSALADLYELVLGLDYPSAGHIDSIGATYLVAIPEGMDEEPPGWTRAADGD
ncbi:MAG: hypothetical protein R3D03_14430 [Geminicoccaceae bacterium]